MRKNKELTKKYSAQHYQNHKALRAAQNKAWRAANRERQMALQADYERKRKQQIAEYKLSMGCAHCGYKGHPAALHFDHLPEHQKSFTISQRTKRKWSVIVAEMEKCQILCANCHAIQTAARHQEKIEKKRSEKKEQQMRLHLA